MRMRTLTSSFPVRKETQGLTARQTAQSYTRPHVLQPKGEGSGVKFKERVEGMEFMSCFVFSFWYVFKAIITSSWYNKAIFMYLPILLKFKYTHIIKNIFNCIDTTFNFEEIEKNTE